MLTRKSPFLFVLMAMFSTAWADTSAVVGQWRLTVDTPRGVTNPILTINAHDSGYSGSYAGPRGTFELKTITVEQNTFAFPMTVTIPIGTMEMQYRGTVEGNVLRGTIGNPRGSIPFSGERIVE